MPSWIVKTAVQRVVSWLPQSHRWNELFQTYITRGLELNPARFEAKLDCCRRHLENYRRFSCTACSDFTVMEIGTGWFPIIPIGLFLCGAKEIWSFDIVPLVRRPHLQQVVRLFSEYASQGRLGRLLPGLRPERVGALRKLDELVTQKQSPAATLELLNIHLRVTDARLSGLPDRAIDFIFSNTVLEHIPVQELVGLLTEFRRVGTPSSVMSHYIGLADQFSSFDQSISPFNFLRYTTSAWRWLNNPIIPQNRLRISDYRVLFRDAGHVIVEECNTMGSREELQRIPLAPEFRAYSVDDLLVLYSWIVTRRELVWAPPRGQEDEKSAICRVRSNSTTVGQSAQLQDLGR
jgi:hypothetical protein